MKLHFVLALIVTPFFTYAQPTISPDAELFFHKAMQQIKPVHKKWIIRTAEKTKQQSIDEAAIRKEATNYVLNFNLKETDIHTLVFLVVAEASNSARNDLKEIMANLKQINKEKEGIRQGQQRLQDSKSSISRIEYDSIRTSLITVHSNKPAKMETVMRNAFNNNLQLKQSAVTMTELNQLQNDLNQRLQIMNETGEMESLRLQMAMDRINKCLSTLNALMKKIGSTNDSILKNLK